uniref:Uncharacterized protein 13J3.11 n=1 Tax=Trypanosoma brucei TaxID=5691 RepID=Q8WPU0_9TRYP|nr:hypothetical protein [Trypanosoma brucei]
MSLSTNKRSIKLPIRSSFLSLLSASAVCLVIADFIIAVESISAHFFFLNQHHERQRLLWKLSCTWTCCLLCCRRKIFRDFVLKYFCPIVRFCLNCYR